MKEKETLKEILSIVDIERITRMTDDEVFTIFHLCIMNNEIFDVAEYCEAVPDDNIVIRFRELTYEIFHHAVAYADYLRIDLELICSKFRNILESYNNPSPTLTITDLSKTEERWGIACNLATKENCKYMKHVFLWMQSYIMVFKNHLSKISISLWIIRLKELVERGVK